MKWLKTALLAVFLLGSQGLHAAPPPAAGSPAPDFSLPDAQGRERHLSEWRGKWLVLYFYPKDDTPGCTTEARNFRDVVPSLAKLNAVVVGISLDDADSHREFAGRHDLPFPLLADAGGAVARRYGALSDFGVLRFARRYTFLVNPEGRIAKVYQQVDAERHAAEVMADLRALAAN